MCIKSNIMKKVQVTLYISFLTRKVRCIMELALAPWDRRGLQNNKENQGADAETKQMYLETLSKNFWNLHPSSIWSGNFSFQSKDQNANGNHN